MSLDSSSAFPAGLRARFQPERVVGRGGMGAVFACRDRELDRPVAVKLMARITSPVARERFEREARTLAQAAHPHVLRIFSHGVEGGIPFLVTELLEGESLDRLEPDPGRARSLVGVAEALDHLHRLGVLHRDVKPSNVFVTREGRPVLLDFGLTLDLDQTRLTEENAVVGTLAYMAPEILLGKPASEAGDWYGWGTAFYYALEGRASSSRDEILRWARTEIPWPVPRFTRVDPDSAEARVALACLEPDPRKRLAGASRIREGLAPGGSDTGPHPSPPPGAASASLPGGRPARTRRRSRSWTAAGALATGVVAASAAWWGARPEQGPEEVRFTAIASPTADPVDREVEGWLRGAETEAEGLDRLRIDERGRIWPPGKTAPEGSTAWISLGPGRWGRAVRLLPATSGLLAWVRRGGRPERLAARQRERLARISGQFRDLGLPPPLAPFLDAVSEPGKTWLEKGQAAYRVGDGLRASYEEAVTHYARTGEAIGGLPTSAIGSRTLAHSGLYHLFVEMSRSPERFEELATWGRSGAEALQRSLHAFVRSIEEDPEERDTAAARAIGALQQLRALVASHLATMEPEDVLGREVREPRVALIAGLLAFEANKVVRSLGEDGAGSEAAARRFMEQVVADPTERRLDPRLDDWKCRAAAILLVLHRRAGRDAELVALLGDRARASTRSGALDPVLDTIGDLLGPDGADRPSWLTPELARTWSRLAGERSESARKPDARLRFRTLSERLAGLG